MKMHHELTKGSYKDQDPNYIPPNGTETTSRKSLTGFANWILNDEEFVVKFLLTLSKWTGAVIFTLLSAMLFWYGQYEFGAIISFFTIFGWYALYKHYFVLGGTKNMPKISAAEAVWGQPDGIKFSGKMFSKDEGKK